MARRTRTARSGVVRGLRARQLEEVMTQRAGLVDSGAQRSGSGREVDVGLGEPLLHLVVHFGRVPDVDDVVRAAARPSSFWRCAGGRRRDRPNDSASHFTMGRSSTNVRSRLKRMPTDTGLEVDRAERLEMCRDDLEDRALALRAGREVLVERHRRRALVRLLVATELACALRADPGHQSLTVGSTSRRRPRACRPCRRAAGRWRTGRRRASGARASRSRWASTGPRMQKRSTISSGTNSGGCSRLARAPSSRSPPDPRCSR